MLPDPTQPRPRSSRILFYAAAVFLPVLALLAFAFWMRGKTASPEDAFVQSMNVGRNFYDRGETAKAIEAFTQAVTHNPTHPDARLNLANACLLAGQAENALLAAEQVLTMDPHSAAAHFVAGCARLRLNQFSEAAKSLQESVNLNPDVAAAYFQLGIAHQQLKQFEEAITAFQTAIAIEPNHPSAHYNLSQALIRTGRTDEAAAALETHQQLAAAAQNSPQPNQSTYERSVHTQARVPFKQEEPLPDGIAVTFSDITEQAFAPAGGAAKFRAPAGVIDLKHTGHNDLFVREEGNSFRLLTNFNGTFHPLGDPVPGIPGAAYSRALVGDLDHGRNEDVVVLGPQGSHVFKLTTNGAITEVTRFSRLQGLQATDGVFVDLDFTGKLDLVAVTSTNTVKVFRNLGNFTFRDITSTSGIPAAVGLPRELILDDWHNDDLMDLFLARSGQPPLLLAKQRGGILVETNLPAALPSGGALAIGDLNNDLRVDFVAVRDQKLEVWFQNIEQPQTIPFGPGEIHSICLLDYDNDGWLDVLTAGQGLRVFRNLGRAGFKETTQALGFASLTSPIQTITPADFDLDGDTDLLLATAQQELRLWRNDGGNAHQQIKLRLVGNRSNSSGLGMRIEVAAGGLRAVRTVRQLPIEIGVGKHRQLDAVTVHWFDLATSSVEFQVEPKQLTSLIEMILPTGSCPYLYVWDGAQFRFVTDLLGAAPVGLPLAEGRYIEADPDEYVWVGAEETVKPRDGAYVVQITEELREVLYLDHAKWIAVDRPPEIEIYPTDKLLPGKPFPPSELAALSHPRPLLKATRHDGLDVTALLQERDGKMLSPEQLRPPQLRGLAEPHSVTLDFGPLPIDRPLVLAFTGWLRFGGGMANVAASHHPDLPFPFPTLEVETADGKWTPVDVAVGAPAGKTKRMFADLAGKLPPDSRRLRLNTAFEIHWDHITLMERAANPAIRITSLLPDSSDLHWRGFSEFADLPWHQPLTPKYDDVRENAAWRINLTGWCTRYGPVDELLAREDDAQVLLNGGDELTLRFAAHRLPEKPPGYVRDFFLFTVGWDKDADFHVAHGTTVEPYPFRGMDDQLYGKQPPPNLPAHDLMRKYNTRWAGPITLDRERYRAKAEPRP